MIDPATLAECQCNPLQKHSCDRPQLEAEIRQLREELEESAKAHGETYDADTTALAAHRAVIQELAKTLNWREMMIESVNSLQAALNRLQNLLCRKEWDEVAAHPLVVAAREGT